MRIRERGAGVVGENRNKGRGLQNSLKEKFWSTKENFYSQIELKQSIKWSKKELGYSRRVMLFMKH